MASARRVHVLKKSDQRYFRRRAEAELQAASKTDNPAACKAHYQLAEAYLDKAFPVAAENDR
jgi:hypothetical protein